MPKKATKEPITISPPKLERIRFTLVGTAPLMQARFSAKAMQAMKAKHEAGSTATKGKKREPRDFEDDFQQALHNSTDGWIGVPAAAIRNASELPPAALDLRPAARKW